MIAQAFNDMLGRLEQAITTQRQFLDDTSHELRTPLTIIRGQVELLEFDPSPAERQETVALVLDEVDRLSRMVDDLFLLAHAQRPDFLRRRRLDLGELLQDVHRKVTALGDRRWHIDPQGEVWVDGDPQRLTQAIMQLVANAVRHTQDGNDVWLATSSRDGCAVVTVADSGPGVDPEDATRIFTRFSRGRAAEPASGAGMGLAIVLAIAEAHGGTARLTAPGSGVPVSRSSCLSPTPAHPPTPASGADATPGILPPGRSSG
ncbi:HAMP domain-containing sensor histidine kinase [Blastococcus brunescens]|uniref:histidine kinase n=2 Tax=Blastococcus brunescens TaxID=1564165 RepID=A0ABZ1B583_9ACTN|nr:HAMP domain-containing sensor histidine kinase [Blastococcus sp. BMG 8361]WRL65894.1 HAMP domain-containing sensor histidine kinase [Blastococcus sp. BMG 8361]